MKSEFTESTFSFAYTHDLIKKIGLLTVPEFISQQEEALRGYDVKIIWKVPMFFQFKVSDFLSKRNAAEANLFQTMPYYRFKLHRDGKRSDVYNQHNLLVNLNRTHPNVYYSAPAFHKKYQLNQFFKNSQVTDNSVLFKPIQMGNGWKTVNHKVVYNSSRNKCYFLSEPKSIETINYLNLKDREEVNLNRKYWSDLIRIITQRMEKQIGTITYKENPRKLIRDDYHQKDDDEKIYRQYILKRAHILILKRKKERLELL